MKVEGSLGLRVKKMEGHMSLVIRCHEVRAKSHAQVDTG